jgi:phosphonate transport system substrate-binding protein
MDRKVSRRAFPALMLAAAPCLKRALGGEQEAVRFAISETLVNAVNINDAKVAMAMWIRNMSAELNLRVEFSPNVFDSTAELVRRTRAGLVDAVALNIVEYRQVADVLDANQIISEAGPAGFDNYVLLAKRGGGIQHCSDMRGRRLCVWKSNRMCAAAPWLSTVLDDARLGPLNQFFGSVNEESKPTQVVLPVFFGKSDVCLTTKHSFDTLCELNPQLGRDLVAIGASQAMVVMFYSFRKSYTGPLREKFARVYTDMRSVHASAAGQQLLMLFQFDQLESRDISCLKPALAVLEKADRIHGWTGVLKGSD